MRSAAAQLEPMFSHHLSAASNTWLARQSAHLSIGPTAAATTTTTATATATTRARLNQSDTMAQFSETTNTQSSRCDDNGSHDTGNNGNGNDNHNSGNINNDDDADDYYCVPDRLSQHYYQAPTGAPPAPLPPPTGQRQEPLIRSDSWQHKTRIDLSGRRAAQTSAWTPVERRRLQQWDQQQQQQSTQCNYYSVATLLASVADSNSSGRLTAHLTNDQKAYQRPPPPPTTCPSLESAGKSATMLIADLNRSEELSEQRLRHTSFVSPHYQAKPNPCYGHSNAMLFAGAELTCATNKLLGVGGGSAAAAQTHNTDKRHKRRPMDATATSASGAPQPSAPLESQLRASHCLALVVLILCATSALVCALMLNARSNFASGEST